MLEPNPGRATGPRTEEGKAVSSLNGETHGFTSNAISPNNEKGQAIFKEKLQGLADSYLPQNAVEAGFLKKMATAETKQELIEEAQAAEVDFASAKFQLLQRYWKDAERAFYRAFNALVAFRKQQAAESNRRFLEEVQVTRMRDAVARGVEKMHKTVKGSGQSIFDRPNSLTSFGEIVMRNARNLPVPEHQRQKADPAASEAAK